MHHCYFLFVIQNGRHVSVKSRLPRTDSYVQPNMNDHAYVQPVPFIQLPYHAQVGTQANVFI